MCVMGVVCVGGVFVCVWWSRTKDGSTTSSILKEEDSILLLVCWSGPLGGGGLSYYNHVNKSRRDNFHREPVRIVEVVS
jgi:hypothetical protein